MDTEESDVNPIRAAVILGEINFKLYTLILFQLHSSHGLSGDRKIIINDEYVKSSKYHGDDKR